MKIIGKLLSPRRGTITDTNTKAFKAWPDASRYLSLGGRKDRRDDEVVMLRELHHTLVPSQSSYSKLSASRGHTPMPKDLPIREGTCDDPAFISDSSLTSHGNSGNASDGRV